MEEFNSQMSANLDSSGGCGFLYGNPADAPMSSSFYLQPLSGDRSDGSDGQQLPIVKAEAAGTSQNHRCAIHLRRETDTVDAMKARIVDHPQYSNLLDAYMNCQKVGAPPEVEARLTEVRREFESQQRSTAGIGGEPKDPELDQFMEAYYDMLVKYGEELSRPLREAMDFMRRIETQLRSISNNPVRVIDSEEDEKHDRNEDESEEVVGMNPCREDRELKKHLLKKYSGYLSSLKQELSKKKKTGKLPKEARQKLLAWWELHYKWPYPSESEKLALAETTGLDQKQINNWFINQRKRHWKPSDDMQLFMVTDGRDLHPQNAAAALYMQGHIWD